MGDRYLEITHTPWGQALTSMFGLPQPPRLKRASGAWRDRPLEGLGVVVGATDASELATALIPALHEAGAQIRVRAELPGLAPVKRAAANAGVSLSGDPVTGEAAVPGHALVFDATGIARPEGLRALYDFFQPLMARMATNGRVVVLGRPVAAVTDPSAAAAAGALLGFVKSLGKEIGRKGATANLIEVAPGSERTLAGTLRFLLSEHAAFVSGQSLSLDAAGAPGTPVWAGSLNGKVALVTGAARGIGASIAEVLAREGATVIGMDRPQEEGALGETLSRINGVGLALDVTSPDAPGRIVQESMDRFGGLDIVVHNAGITRDKTLRNMQPHLWNQVLDVNLAAIVRVNEQLLARGLKAGARMVCISSIGGIAGNAGQTNYGATKAGVIGYVRALAPEMARRGGAVNAVAPGFIETQMTAAMPVGPRVAGRLMSSLSQGGLPIDIAEAVAFFASPFAAGLNGRTLRVCGQHLVGA